VVYRFIDDYKTEFGLRWLLRGFGLSSNAYYNYKKNRKAHYNEYKAYILEEIQSLYYNNNQVIGHRGMVIFLARRGIRLSKATAHKYMNKTLNLHSIVNKKPPSDNKEKACIFPNLLNQDFDVKKANQVWCTDITYNKLSSGQIRYNCTILDLYRRKVIGSANSAYANSDLAIDALSMAIESEQPLEGLLLHSDRGSQFTSWAFVAFCKDHGITQSMSKSGCPYDNAPMERYYRTLKSELLNNHSIDSAVAFDEVTSDYAFVWYNQIRPHSYNGGLTPSAASTEKESSMAPFS